MPNRIIKESICTSETIDALSFEAEAFFYRLLVQCDDFGRMDARPAVLRARNYPLRLGTITDQQVSEWLKELAGADLLWVYESEGRPYLQITTWDKHQQRRAKHSKYPQPPERASNGNHVIAVASNSPRGIEESRIRGIEKRGSDIAPESTAQEGDPVKELAAVFETAAGIKLPKPSGPKASKQVGAMWWAPLRAMVAMADGRAPDILRSTITNMRRDGMNISSPNSTLKVFTSKYGETQAAPAAYNPILNDEQKAIKALLEADRAKQHDGGASE